MSEILTIPFTAVLRRMADVVAALDRGFVVHLIYRGTSTFELKRVKTGTPLPVGFAQAKSTQSVGNVTSLAPHGPNTYIETEEEQQEADADQLSNAAGIEAKVKEAVSGPISKPIPDKNDTSYLYAADDLPAAKLHVDTVKGRK